MTRHHSLSRIVSVGLILLTLLASLLMTTHKVSITHAAPLIHVPLTDYAQPPASWVGKVFAYYLKNVNGASLLYMRICTGAVVGSTNESVVETAAHCLYDPDTKQLIPANKIIFCPQYHDGQAPLGCWTGQQVFIASHFTLLPTDKLTIKYSINDYAFLVVSRLKGEAVANAVTGGVTAVSSTLVGTSPVVSYGYPGIDTINGKELFTCEGPLIDLNVKD